MKRLYGRILYPTTLPQTSSRREMKRILKAKARVRCENCRKLMRFTRKDKRFCSPKCRFDKWSELHPVRCKRADILDLLRAFTLSATAAEITKAVDKWIEELRQRKEQGNGDKAMP